ncbi:DoxX-like family protein [Lysinibacillus pakistanensis]|uniref:DoxX-like family protein n=1 Tax=Lysinibacillus pakistanensis TaxID=759811 RepID=A0AAX3X1L4_9BACI|nr:DoxX-like family protein [Lysinibacillus pakistanensis]MDM5233303.1 DoxX-like family protein [Lysinibacillus pakistanensis]WHY48779.1 DoxX-like family protein [Lysinibacillus pakistanensis]WHY53791.1 DoxX-like family protein [Lysinibacillus pakistanensis]
MKKKPIYVEVDIFAPIEEAWTYTQNPKLHEQWDLRFTSITYIEKKSVEEPQRFTYETKVMPGVVVRGWGESKGEHQKKDGTKTSSLHFGTPQKISPIAGGRGYWQYLPHDRGLTFLTQYDYDVRYGKFGKLMDAMFRPMMGWATALSFDVLKRWLEKGENPASQYRRFFLTIFISILFCIVWVYHGLVPKIIVQHPTEVVLVENILEKDLQSELGPSGYIVELSGVGVGPSGIDVRPSETELGQSGIEKESSETELGQSGIGKAPSEFRSRSSETEGESSKIKLNLSKTMAKPNEDVLSWSNANQIVIWIGIAEILFGLCWLFLRGKRLLFGAQIILFPLLTIGALLADITIATAPFNPVTFNLALWVLSIIGFIISKDMPSARRCIRKREETT